MNQELLDFDTFVEVRKAAPKVTVMPFDVAAVVVEGMDRYSNDRVRCQNCGHVFITEPPNMNETARIFWCGGCGCEVEGHEIALTGQHEACGEFVQVRTVFVPVPAFEMA